MTGEPEHPRRLQYTAQQLAAFKAEATRRRRVIAVAVIVLTAAVHLVILSRRSVGTLDIHPRGWMLIGVAVVASAAIFWSRFARCPACNGWLGEVRRVPACRKCGVPLQ